MTAEAAAGFARLRWRCRRGMRELDTLLTAFLEHGYPSLDEADRARFEALLELPDPQIHAWLLGRERPADPAIAQLVERVGAPRSV